MMKFWLHDNVVYVSIGNKICRLDDIMSRRAYFQRCHEIRDEYTKRRQWWRRNVKSRDMPDSKAARADYTDGGRWGRRLGCYLDGEYDKSGLSLHPFAAELNGLPVFKCAIAKRNCMRIARRMMLGDWRRVGKFVASVWKYGSKERDKTMLDFGISETNYYWRIDHYASILGFGTRVDMC